MKSRKELERLFTEHGYIDFKWINAKDIVVADWVRFKCLFGCGSSGERAFCPPNTPSVNDCRSFFSDYTDAVIFRFEHTVERPEDRFAWSRKVNLKLLELERDVFLAGYHKAFLLFMDECRICSECRGLPEECVNKRDSRPCPESFAVDVFATVKSAGYPIEVLTKTSQTMNRYAFLMIE